MEYVHGQRAENAAERQAEVVELRAKGERGRLSRQQQQQAIRNRN